MVLSNKGILPILWELNPGHPNLLECYRDGPHDMQSYVVKPILSREGANIDVVENNVTTIITKGEYADEPKIYQAFAPLPNFDGNFPVIGSWVIGDIPAGIGIRDGITLVTDNFSQFIPHIVRD